MRLTTALAFIPLLLVATPALATGPIVTENPTIACPLHNDWLRLKQMIRDKDRVAAKAFLEKNCLVIPAGFKLYADLKIDLDECLRIEGQTDCVWGNAIVYLKTHKEP
jgi:hypothetical protein